MLLAHGNVVVLESVASGKTLRVYDDGKIDGTGGSGALGKRFFFLLKIYYAIDTKQVFHTCSYFYLLLYMQVQVYVHQINIQKFLCLLPHCNYPLQYSLLRFIVRCTFLLLSAQFIVHVRGEHKISLQCKKNQDRWLSINNDELSSKVGCRSLYKQAATR